MVGSVVAVFRTPRVHDDVDPAEQLVKGAGNGNRGGFHLMSRFVTGRADWVATLDGHPDVLVGDHVGHADELHVVLQRDGVGHALADVAVAAHGDPSSGIACHREPPPASRSQSSVRRSSCALMATMIVLSDISTAPTAGVRTRPHGASTPAASGIATML
jgi:hypothetical protein